MPFFIMDLKKDYQERVMEITAKEQVVGLRLKLRQEQRKNIHLIGVYQDVLRDQQFCDTSLRCLIVILALFEIVLFFYYA